MEDNHFCNRLLSTLNFRLLFSENNDYCFQKSKSPHRFFSQAGNPKSEITFRRCTWNLNTDVNRAGCYNLGEVLLRMQILTYTHISVLLHYSHWEGPCCFQSLKTLPFTAAKEMTREEKHSQCISAINSIHNCPAVCARRNWPVSPPSFGHWKLIRHFQRCGLGNASGMRARSHGAEGEEMKSRLERWVSVLWR